MSITRFRQAIISQILVESGQPIGRIRLFKLAFLVSNNLPNDQQRRFYDFLPYHYGPYSFSLNSDLERMRSSGTICFTCTGEVYYSSRESISTKWLPTEVREIVRNTVRQFLNLTDEKLIDTVYDCYPYFTVLSKNKKLYSCKVAHPAVYTIGYETTSIDAFLRELIWGGILRIVDVRSVAFSYTYGFSQKSLSHFCSKVGIEYVHLPNLGIPPAVRKTRLLTDESRQKLLDEYEKTVLPSKTGELEKAAQLITEKPSALMCVEADAEKCHRLRVARWLSRFTGLDIINLRVNADTPGG